jgi:hypothetical protein
MLENISSPANTVSPEATIEPTSEQKNEQKNRITKAENHITKTVTWKPDVDDGWTLVKRKKRSQQRLKVTNL